MDERFFFTRIRKANAKRVDSFSFAVAPTHFIQDKRSAIFLMNFPRKFLSRSGESSRCGFKKNSIRFTYWNVN